MSAIAGAEGFPGPPVLIGCMPRSGSSLLRMMLDSHPSLTAGAETHWLTSDDPREGFRAILRAAGDVRCVVKSPANISVPAIDILSETQQAMGVRFSMIHIYRNPLDVASSYLKTLAPDAARTEFSADARRFVLGYRRLREACPFELIEVSYEDLVKETRRTLVGVCAFLGLALDPAMLRHHERAHEVLDHYSDRNARFPVFPTSIGQVGRYRELVDEEMARRCRELSDLLPRGGRRHWRPADPG